MRQHFFFFATFFIFSSCDYLTAYDTEHFVFYDAKFDVPSMHDNTIIAPHDEATSAFLAENNALVVSEKGEDLTDRLKERFVIAADNGAAYGAKHRLSYDGLSKNTRQTSLGYWLGSEPSAQNIGELHARGVRIIVSATKLPSPSLAKVNELSLRHVDIAFGGKFPRRKGIAEQLQAFSPGEIFIHCEHGGDRSGAVLAFLLVAREGWSPQRALLSVMLPGEKNVKEMIAILGTHGYEVNLSDLSFVGIYSAELNGGFGGLKVFGESYKKLIRTTLRAMDETLKFRDFRH